MNQKLRAMLVSAGVFLLGGIGVYVYTPQPAGRTMAELKDAGVLLGQPLVLECSEKLTPQTRRRINAAQPGALRPKQVYARVARSARCFSPDGGNCFRANNSVARIGDLDGELIIPSLRHNLTGIDLDASVGIDDGGDSDDVDDSLQFRNDTCEVYGCTHYDDLIDAGLRVNPFQSRYCNALNRLSLAPLPCMIPLCLGSDGGWDDNAVVDCRATGPYGEMDGGSRWRGCNATPTAYTTGAACVPVECGTLSGDSIIEEWL